MGLSQSLIDTLSEIPDATVVEIGVARGENAERFLKDCNVKMYYGVDPYKPYIAPPSSDFQYGYVDLKMASTKIGDKQESWEHFYEEAKERLKPYKNRAKIIRMFAHEAVNEIKDPVDVVYIDGNHQYEYVLNDMNTWWPHLKPGGLMIGDDYGFNGGKKQENYGGRKASEVDKACYDFCKRHNLEFYNVNAQFVIVKPYHFQKTTKAENFLSHYSGRIKRDIVGMVAR